MILKIMSLILLILPLIANAQPSIGGAGRITSLGQIAGAVCSDGEVMLNVDGTSWACAPSGVGGSVMILDLADDDSNESAGIVEIATTGDTNSIFTEPTANKLLINVGQAWSSADALSANPTNCSATEFARGIDASGNAEGCAAALALNQVNSEASFEITLGEPIVTLDEIDSIAELESIVGSVNILTAPEVDSVAVLESLTSDNIITASDIDTEAELEAILGEDIVIQGELLNINATTADALSANPTNCTSPQVPLGIDASGNAEGCFTPVGAGDLSAADIDTEAEFEVIVGVDYAKVSDNVATATALASDPANCGAGNAAAGIDANGVGQGCFDVVVSTEIDTEVELEAITSLDFIVSTEIDSESELEAIVGVNYLKDTDIDTEAKLEATIGGADLAKVGDNVATATSLASNPSNCAAGQAAAGVDASGVAEGCFVPSGGGGGVAQGSIDAAFDVGKVVDGANSLANAAVFGNGTDAVSLYGLSGEGIVEGPASGDVTLDPDNDVVIQMAGSTKAVIAEGEYTFPAGSTLGWRKIFLTADSFRGDGVICTAEPLTVANAGAFQRFITCSQTSGGLLTTITPISMPKNWNGSGLITRLAWYEPDGDSSQMVFRTVAKCRGNGTSNADAWGSESNDQTTTFSTSGAITWSGESSNVTADGVCTGDPVMLHVELRQQSSSSAGATNARFVGADIHYQITSAETR